MLYAFAMQNSDPSNITLSWAVGCMTDTSCSSGFSGIGQTWSPAKILKASYNSGTAPLLIMGGGYDTCEDADPNNCTSSSKGSQIYVLDASSGALLKTLKTDRSVAAEVVVVPDSTTGLAKLAYAADLGGNIYRINIGTDNPANWTITKIASLGCSTTASCQANRKFLFAPDVLESNGEYSLLIGSGDREKPLLYYTSASSVKNYFFMLRDKPSDGNWLKAESTTCGAEVICLGSLLAITTSATPSAADLGLKKGWYLGLAPTEQVVTSAITIFGVVTFSTHTPDVPQAGACTAQLGTARVYNISYTDASSPQRIPDRSELLPADTGLPPSPVAGMVVIDTQTGKEVAFCIGCSAASAIEVQEPVVPVGGLLRQPKGRVYWYIQR